MRPWLRGVRDARALEHVQRVEIGAQADRALAVSLAQHADDPGPRQPAMDFQPEGFELLGDELRGRFLLERGLRVSVDMVAPFLHLRDGGGDFGQDVHVLPRPLRDAARRTDGSKRTGAGLR